MAVGRIDNFGSCSDLARAFGNVGCSNYFGEGLDSIDGYIQVGLAGLIANSPKGACFADLDFLVVVFLGEGLFVIVGISDRTSA